MQFLCQFSSRESKGSFKPRAVVLVDWWVNFHIFWGSDLCNYLCSTPTSLDLCRQLLYKLLLILLSLVHVSVCTQQPCYISGDLGKNMKSRLPGMLDFNFCGLYLLACYRTQKGISPRTVSQRPFSTDSFAVSVCSAVFWLYLQNEKLGLKVCHSMSEELFTKPYSCFQTFCCQ